MMKRGQPYLGAFLLKDENTDSDVITDINSVHHVGVFAQITSVFSAQGKDEKEEGLTAVLYPHRRIKLTQLVKTGSGVSTGSVVNVEEGLDGMPTPPATPPPIEEKEKSGESTVKPTGRTCSSVFHLLYPHKLTRCINNQYSSSANCFPSELRHLPR